MLTLTPSQCYVLLYLSVTFVIPVTLRNNYFETREFSVTLCDNFSKKAQKSM